MGKSALGVSTIDPIVEGRTERKKSSEDGLFDTRGIGLCHGMEARRSMN
jgi:hypothetical protein